MADPTKEPHEPEKDELSAGELDGVTGGVTAQGVVDAALRLWNAITAPVEGPTTRPNIGETEKNLK